MVVLKMNEGSALVKRDGDVCGQIEFVGESESGEYVFCPRSGTVIFRSTDLVEIARQVAFLNGATSQPVETKTSAAETPAEVTETKTKGDAAADKIIAAFQGEEYLADSDLLKASGLSRKGYIEVWDYLLYETCELVELESEEDGVTVYAYAKPRKQAAA
jgi:hypothetical protein